MLLDAILAHENLMAVNTLPIFFDFIYNVLSEGFRINAFFSERWEIMFVFEMFFIFPFVTEYALIYFFQAYNIERTLRGRFAHCMFMGNLISIFLMLLRVHMMFVCIYGHKSLAADLTMQFFLFRRFWRSFVIEFWINGLVRWRYSS